MSKVTVLFALFLYGFGGVTIVVSESTIDHGLISDDGGTFTTQVVGNASISNISCYIHGSCSCSSLCNALTNLTSNVLINITSDVMLSSIIPLVDLANITIMGHNNPTVDCNNSGGLLLTSCSNIEIEGIYWKNCGAKNATNDDVYYPVIQLLNSSNATIKYCSFEHSVAQTIMLSRVSGDVNIKYCNFISNTQHKEHGSAIYYSMNNSPLDFTIANCEFSYNEGAKSVVYIEGPSVSAGSLVLQDSEFHDNKGVPVYLCNQADLHIKGNVTIYNNAAENGGGLYVSDHSSVIIHKTATVNFTNNTAGDSGGAVFLTNHSSIFVEDSPSLNLYDCKVQFIKIEFYSNKASYGGAIYTDNSIVTFEGCTVASIISNSATIQGGSIESVHSIVTFGGHSAVMFSDNTADYDYGGGIKIGRNSNMTFKGNSSVTFSNNSATYAGGAVFIAYASVKFKENSTVIFNNNICNYGGAMVADIYSIIVFEDHSTAIFNNNNAHVDGGAMLVDDYSNITFNGSSIVTFNDNNADNNGGVVITHLNAIVTFKGDTIVTFNNNNAGLNGGVIFTDGSSTITFEGSSTVICHNNSAGNYGGALAISDNSTITFEGNSTIAFNNNNADVDGGAVSIDEHAVIIFTGNTNVMLNNNNADNDGGGIFIDNHSHAMFEGTSTMILNNNRADFGGAAFVGEYSTVKFKENCVVTFSNNGADKDSGALYIDDYSTVTFTESSTVAFNNNTANYGGALSTDDCSTLKFEGNCTVTFDCNSVNKNGGAMAIYDKSTVTFEEHAIVTFTNNSAGKDGGAMDIDDYSIVTFKDSSAVIFHNNSADEDGGAVNIYDKATVKFEKKSSVTFDNNRAKVYGGAIFIDDHSTVTFEGNTKLKCSKNSANLGGTIFIESSQISINENSYADFTNNIAFQDGGAVYLSSNSKFTISSNSNITFYSNTANDYGGAIYVLLKESSVYFNSSNINFKDNSAGIIHKPIYLNIPKSCNSSCVSQSVYMTNKTIVFTTPSKLLLYSPAKCIDGNRTNCNTYYMKNIMLGEKITLDACVLDYFGQPIEAATEFLLTGTINQDFKISGSKYISVFCNYTTEGISIVGNLHSNVSYNYSLTISLHVAHISELNISVNLTTELSQCHSGFSYSNKSQKCECYDSGNIVSCTGSNSTIRRGYWFGSVAGIDTVASCPNDYCNFTCCEITNGIYHLSPVRLNQCRPHRSGTACGSCEKGYTLSFDSIECVHIDECTATRTVLVTTLSLLYWIAVVVVVFAMTYFKITIGSLYAIIYYYSVVDILLGRVLYISDELHITVNIMSSLVKLNPQFLGKLCLVRNMSGIDQQFIHYIHPTAVLLILIMISMLARKSRRVSSFVSRGIIHFICFLLLLSYTSVASTSLLLMRSLKFLNIDRVYTYLSPEIEYFHDRHLAYVMIAVVFMVTIVIGLPLLLLLEPFLNSKINFVKLKPLLDQFQCCYKDKYRWFAGYYMVCRIVIILLVIVKISDDFTSQYLLLLTCTAMASIHLAVRPYASTFLNIFDGAILQFIVILSVLPMVEFVNYYNETFVLVIVYLLFISPFASYVAIKLWLNRSKIQKAFNDCKRKFSHEPYHAIPTDGFEELGDVNEVSGAVGDDMRNTSYVIVKINQPSQEHLPNIEWCREPFLETMNDIEALNDMLN